MPRSAKPSDLSPTETAQREYFQAIHRPKDRSLAWYLNLLAGTVEGPVPGRAPHTERQAACLWAGVPVQDYTMQGALNLKAGNVLRSDWLPVEAALNQLAQNKTLADFKATRGRLVGDQEALYAVCQRLFG